MSRQPSTYAVPMTPVTPIWANGHDIRSVQRQRLLPSAIEMTTPPQTVPRKAPGYASAQAIRAPPMPLNENGPSPQLVHTSPGMDPNMSPHTDPGASSAAAAAAYAPNMYPAQEMPALYPSTQSPRRPSRGMHAPLPQQYHQQHQHQNQNQQMAEQCYGQNPFHAGRAQGAYPSLRLSYAHYYDNMNAQAMDGQTMNAPPPPPAPPAASQMNGAPAPPMGVPAAMSRFANSGRVTKLQPRRFSGGIPNGFPNGMPEGIPEGMPNGMPNGIPNGMHNRMHSGMAPVGMPASLVNGMPVGMPAGMTNGMANGMANSMANGMAVNMPNSMPNGMPAGMPAGMQAARGRYDNEALTPENYKSEIKDRYSAYNHYILRHASEEKSKVIWPAEVEAAFMEAVWLIPGDSCKILMDRRTRGRNELISDYLKHKVGESRSRKQVSSHLQVLKKLLRDDEEFLEYVGPKKGESEAEQKESSKSSRPDMSASSLEQLISKLKHAKRDQPKPAFLLQAEANLRQSQREEAKHSSRAPHHMQPPYHIAVAGMPPSQPIPQMHQAVANHMVKHEEVQEEDDNESTEQEHHHQQHPHQHQHSPLHHQQEPHPHQLQHQHPHPHQQSQPQQAPNEHSPQDPPLRHPRPVHAQDLGGFSVEPLVTPSASVPPKDFGDAVVPSPRRSHHMRHHSRHHRRTTSTSVDLSGDRVLPVQFRMARTSEHEQLIFSRLIRATYESPTRPLELRQLTPNFSDLADLEATHQLDGAQVVHANVALYVKPGLAAAAAAAANSSGAGPDPQTLRSQYSSDVQFVVTSDAASSVQHRYIAKTVVTSRSAELLRCDIPCLFHKLAGRGLELDKEVINVPFLPDFWADFLARLSESDPEYIQAALSALTMHQAIYRVSNDAEELIFVSLYQFSAAQDEFTARTRFRRVKGVPPAPVPASASASASNSIALDTTEKLNGSPQRCSTVAVPAIREPSTPTRSNKTTNRNMEQTPKPLSTPALLGIGTPGQALSSLGNFMNCDSPSIFASPRRIHQVDGIELSGSPFTSAMATSDSRVGSGGGGGSNGGAGGSPWASRPEIQRAVTAFEPSAWDEMHDWIYQ